MGIIRLMRVGHLASVTYLVSELLTFPPDSAALSDMDKGVGGGFFWTGEITGTHLP